MDESCKKKAWSFTKPVCPFKYTYTTQMVNQSQSVSLISVSEITFSSVTAIFSVLITQPTQLSFNPNSENMRNLFQEQVVGIPISSTFFSFGRPTKRLTLESYSEYNSHCSSDDSTKYKQSKVDSMLNRMNKLGRKADRFAHGVREHVRLGPKITETVKGKLSLGAKIFQVGGVEKVFKRSFSVREGEKLIKASQCYLSTTTGPIAGLLFITTDKIAFCSEKSIKFSTPNGETVRVLYKVLIPLGKIEGVNQSENVKKPSQKYMEIVTVDNFEFWFMGFVNYQKALKHIQQAITRI